MMSYIIDIIDYVFLVKVFDSIKSPMLYGILITMYLTVIIACVGIIVYLIFPGDTDDKTFIIVSICAWIQILRFCYLQDLNLD